MVAIRKSEKRKQIEELILRRISIAEEDSKIKPNTERYTKLFASMNDKDFEKFMEEIKNGSRVIDFIVPNFKMNVKNKTVLKLVKECGMKSHERLRYYDSATKRKFITPEEYMIGEIPVRRLKQHLQDKRSMPESDTTIDLNTGQVIKPDKGASMSSVELTVIVGKGLLKTATELFNIRGGNIQAYASFKAQAEEYGEVNLSEISAETRPRSATVAKNYLLAMHIDNNI